jgi:large subunit ribosomal protein L3
MKGILGRKVGMTGVFSKSGKLLPVTVIEVEPNVVTQVKTEATDGYNAIQLGFKTKKDKLSNKPEQGHVKKANTEPKRFFKEIKGVDVNHYELGNEVKADIFEAGEIVDVTGTSKGKGFQGVIKRHNQSTGPMGHGSHYHRGPGSMGTMRPMRVFKGKKLPGHMGSETVTIQNLEVIAVDLENNVILIKGNVPGPKGSLVIIKSSVKKVKPRKEKEELISYVEEIIEEVMENQDVEVSDNEDITDEQTTEQTEETEEKKEEASQE